MSKPIIVPDVVRRGYTWKLYPTPEQEAALNEQCRMVAQLWNALLQRREDVYRRERRTLTRFALEYEITALYREMPEWRALSTWTGRRVNRVLEVAFDAFFRRIKQGADKAGYPRYKRTHGASWLPHRCASGCKITHVSGLNWQLRLKGIEGVIHARGRLPDDTPTAADWFNADIKFRDGRWWISISTHVEPRLIGGGDKYTIRFNLIDGLAEVNGRYETPKGLLEAQAFEEKLDALKADRALRWPMRAPQDPEWVEVANEISRLSARIARVRHNALHVWTTRIVQRARDITVLKPRIKELTASPRGDARSWGAAVSEVSSANRKILGFAAASAVNMLQYKSAEAGIRCDLVEDEAPVIAIGRETVRATRKLRQLSRKVRRTENGEGIDDTSQHPQ